MGISTATATTLAISGAKKFDLFPLGKWFSRTIDALDQRGLLSELREPAQANNGLLNADKDPVKIGWFRCHD